MVGDRQQRVGVRRQVDPDDLGLLVHHVVDEAGVLMREPVVVLPPYQGGEQVVQRRDRAPPGDLPGGLEPLGVLVEHRVDDVDERLVAVEHPVPAGQQVALQPALAQVLGQHLHHPAVGGQVVVAVDDLRVEGAVGHLEHVLQPVGGGLVRPEQPEVGRVARDDVPQPRSQDSGALGLGGARAGDGDGVVAEVGQLQVAQQQAAVGVRVGAHPPVVPGRQRGQLGRQRPVRAEQLGGPVGPHPLLELGQVRGVAAHVGDGDLVGAEGALDLAPRPRSSARSSPWACAARSSATAAGWGRPGRGPAAGCRRSRGRRRPAWRRAAGAPVPARRPPRCGRGTRSPP